jgi:hypothetical protein
MSTAFFLGSPNLWLPLDGSVYSIPAVVETSSLDSGSFDSYTDLALRPSPYSMAIADGSLATTLYEGSYTNEYVDDDRGSTFVDGYFRSVDTYTFSAWYHSASGLLLKSHMQAVNSVCYEEGDYVGDNCPVEPVDMQCALTATSMPLQ